LLEIGYRSTTTISDVVQDIVGHAVEIHITVARGWRLSWDDEVSWPPPIESNMPENLPSNRPKPTELNPKYVFSRFVVGSSRMAHAASSQLLNLGA